MSKKDKYNARMARINRRQEDGMNPGGVYKKPTGRLDTPPAPTDRLKKMFDAAPGFDKVVPEFLNDGPTLANSVLGGHAGRGVALLAGKAARSLKPCAATCSRIATSQKFVVDKSLMTEVTTASMARPKTCLKCCAGIWHSTTCLSSGMNSKHKRRAIKR